MAIEVSERIPAGSLQTMTRDGVETLSSDDIFAGKRVVLFAVPGAFTPSCSDVHLPGFLARAEEFAAHGVDTLACLAVNDVYVMEAWRQQSGAAHHILMLADGNGDYVRALGLELDASRWGMGLRSRRFAAVIDDGLVRVLGIENGPVIDASGAESILEALQAL